MKIKGIKLGKHLSSSCLVPMAIETSEWQMLPDLNKDLKDLGWVVYGTVGTG